MPSVHKSAIVPHPCAEMFALVDAVERYPEFLPWCGSAQVVERTGELTLARIGIDYHGLRAAFATRNEKRGPHEIVLQLAEGPFERLQGCWRFAALGDAGCRVELVLDYELSSAAARALLAPVFSHIAETLVERFVVRAEVLAGQAGGR